MPDSDPPGLRPVQELAMATLQELHDKEPAMSENNLAEVDPLVNRLLERLQPLAVTPILEGFINSIRNDMYNVRGLQLGFLQVYLLGIMGLFDHSIESATTALKVLDKLKEVLLHIIESQRRAQAGADLAKDERAKRETEPCP